MIDLEEENLSISAFAEMLIEEQTKGKSAHQIQKELQPRGDPEAPDIRQIEIDETDVDKILAESFGVKSEVKKVTQAQSKPQRNAEALLKEFNDLLIKGKALIQEMTTCGMIGVGTTRPGATKIVKKKKKLKLKEGDSTGFLPAETGQRLAKAMKRMSAEQQEKKKPQLHRINKKVADRPFVQAQPGKTLQQTRNKRFSWLKKSYDKEMGTK